MKNFQVAKSFCKWFISECKTFENLIFQDDTIRKIYAWWKYYPITVLPRIVDKIADKAGKVSNVIKYTKRVFGTGITLMIMA